MGDTEPRICKSDPGLAGLLPGFAQHTHGPGPRPSNHERGDRAQQLQPRARPRESATSKHGYRKAGRSLWLPLWTHGIVSWGRRGHLAWRNRTRPRGGWRWAGVGGRAGQRQKRTARGLQNMPIHETCSACSHCNITIADDVHYGHKC